MKTPLAVLILLINASIVIALNKGNAGPKDVELKFDLPAPAPLTAEEALKTFRLPPGFRIELVASEPMIETPVAISFDDQGRLYVVEMRGYMRDLDGTTENEAIGRVSLLTDTDQDGRMDRATRFVDSLVMPRGVMAIKGGALVAEPPNLFYCCDTDGDGVADKREPVTSDFGSKGGQPEHMANSPIWAMDNRIYAAGYGSSFRLIGDTWQRHSGLGRGQWGLCQDDAGRLFFNYNSDLLRTDLLPAFAFVRNPILRTSSSINFQVMKDQSVYPSHPTPGVNRGYDPKFLRPDGTLARATATCGAVVYRGDAFPSEYRGDAFVPEPSANLVKRLKLTERDGIITATDANPGTEFLTSTDERFRPVMMANGPDGALYVVDMYRGMLQHPAFLTHYLVANIKARNLEAPINKGRIWRIVRDDPARTTAAKLPTSVSDRVSSLTHANGWVRDTAQRLIVESGDTSAAPALRVLFTDASKSAKARLHALWVMDGLGVVTSSDIRVALRDADVQIRAAAVRIASPELLPDLISIQNETAPLVLAHLAIRFSSVNQSATDQALAKLLTQHGHNALVREGALSGARGREVALAQAIVAVSNQTSSPATIASLEALATLVSQAGKAGPYEQMLGIAAGLTAQNKLCDAVLRGLDQTPSNTKSKRSTTLKTLWLSSEPVALTKLRSTIKSGSTLTHLNSLTKRLAWVGKPGAPAPPKVTSLNKSEQARFDKGKAVFESLCAPCHQPHGYGLDGLAPPLVDSDWVLGKPDVTAKIILQGLGGPIKVANRTWDLTMPPMGMLNDEDIASVLTYIRREWEHTASPVDAKFIAGIRKQTTNHPNSWTAEELRPPQKSATKTPTSK